MLKKIRGEGNDTILKVTTTGTAVNRYLQYWIIYAIISSLLSSFSPVLAWMPLSTHLTWVLWAYIQLESTTSWMYNVVEWDLMAFGMLHSPSHHKNVKESGGLQDAMTIKLINSILTKVPSAQHGHKDGEEVPSQDLKTTTPTPSMETGSTSTKLVHKDNEEREAFPDGSQSSSTLDDDDASKSRTDGG